MISPATLITALWAVWLVVWLLAARSTSATVARQTAHARLTHSILLAAGAVLFFFHPPAFGILNRSALPRDGAFIWAGVIATGVGLAFAVWARAHLGRLWSGTVTL